MVPLSIFVSLGFTAVFLVLGTKARHIYSVALTNSKSDGEWNSSHSKSIRNFRKRSSGLTDKEKKLQASIERRSCDTPFVNQLIIATYGLP